MDGPLLTVRNGDAGHGVYAAARLPADSDLLFYRGPKLGRPADGFPGPVVQVAPGLFVDASGGPGEFVHHSCDPTAALVIHGDDGNDVRLVALRDLAAGDPVTLDYAATLDGTAIDVPCGCGSPGCRGRLQEFKYLPPAVRRRYAERGVVPAYNLRHVDPRELPPMATAVPTFTFDPTYGYTEDQLLAVVGPPDPPADFADFWRGTFAAAIAVPPRPTRREVRRTPRLIVEEVEFDAWAGDAARPVRLGGWLTTPATGPVTSGLVVGHGYGGRTAPDPTPLVPGAAVLYPCLRGFNRSVQLDIPGTADPARAARHPAAATRTSTGSTPPTCGPPPRPCSNWNPRPRRWRTPARASAAASGAMMLPWDARYQRAFLDYPSFGHHPIRLTLPCIGSGESVRRNGGSAHLPVLRYFDAATAASHVTVPTMVAAALFDPAVPPPGQFAIHNSLPGERALFVRRNAHVAKVGTATVEDRLVDEAALDWLGRV